MFTKHIRFIFCLCLCLAGIIASAHNYDVNQYNVVWNTPSKNSSESMPCGGGDIGLNVWVENDDLFFYIAKSGTFDENNSLLKSGRVRVNISPNPFAGQHFRQELRLKEGFISIQTGSGKQAVVINIWVDVFQPVIHVSINANSAVTATATYENWRYKNRTLKGKENNANSYKWAPPESVITAKDNIAFADKRVLFFHQNKQTPSIFDNAVKQQGLDAVKQELFNPLENLVFGGSMQGSNMQPTAVTEGLYADTDFKGWQLKSIKAAKKQEFTIVLHTAKANHIADWQKGLDSICTKTISSKTAWANTQLWWQQYWNRSFIHASGNDSVAAISKNYALFRYMLGCNAYGKYPTKFNGGLFTVDPVFTDSAMHFTPDFRNWGGGTHTAQNQRLVYFPMLRSGDFDMMKPQFDFYLQMLKNAELRSKFYWNHEGACFTEQIENFGLPNYAEYGTKRPAGFDKGMEYNAWLEYEWDTVLEFCLMILETQRYADADIQQYIPLIESSLEFFNQHYQYLAKQRGAKAFDGNGKLVLFPGSAAETYKMAYNSSSTVAALQTVLKRLIALPENYLSSEKKLHWDTMLNRIPAISYRQLNGHTTIAPAALWQRVNNTESPQLYPVFPWGIYGVGRPGLDTAINTWQHDTDVIKFRSHVGWKQDNIFAARLGLSSEAARLNSLKMASSGRRFPAFWGPGYDWVPDHNWGGSGMIGMQEMLMQTDDKKIYLLPAWPADWNVHFKLNAPYNTTVEAVLKNGEITLLKVLPASRAADVQIMLPQTVK